MNKILVIGGSGLLGSKIVSKGSEDFQVFGTFHSHRLNSRTDLIGLNKCNREKTLSLIKEINPIAVIDTAAMHNVDYCEKNPDESYKINVSGTKNVAEACRETWAKMVFISTDYVFDGEMGGYSEKDTPNPQSVYARHKLEAENVVKETLDDWAVVRTSVIYGWDEAKFNFVTWTIDKLQKKEAIKIVDDQYSSPTLADNLAEALLSLIKKDKRGLYHIAGNDCVNRHDLTLKIAYVFGLDKSLVTPIATKDLNQLAKRPMMACLDVSKAQKELNIRLLRAEEGLKKMKNMAKT